MKKYIYVASPYSSPDPRVREERYQLVLQECAAYVTLGIPIFSPIVHFHPIDKVLLKEVSHPSEFWDPFWKPLLLNSSLLLVLPFPGYKESRGIKEERKIAQESNIPEIVSFMFNDVVEAWEFLNGK
jgi:hypothetical protein